MIYLLDTNTCIQYLTGRSENVINKFKITHRENICLCDVVKGELYYGAFRSVKKEQNLALYELFFSKANFWRMSDNCRRVRNTQK